MRRRTSSTAASAAMRCPIGWPTSRSGWRRSARPRPSWRRKPKPPPKRRCGAGHRRKRKRNAEGRKKNGKTPAPPKQEPDGKTQRNFTDPESRILKTKDGYIQGYNAQAAVDAEAQIIVAHGLTHEHERPGPTRAAAWMGSKTISAASPRKPQPMPATAARRTLRPWPSATSAPTSQPDAPSIPATSNERSQGRSPRPCATSSSGRDGEAGTGCRKQIVEPVFGQIKQARGFRQFLLRGIEKVRAEWALICTAHNLTKLAPAA